MKIVVADDHELIANGVIAYFANKKEFTFYTAASKKYLIDILKKERIDVVLQDIQFGREDGRAIQSELSREYPQLKFVALSSFTDEFTVQSTLKTGFHGYISKSAPLSEIEAGLHAIQNNEVFISSDIKDKMLHAILSGNREEVILTKREKQVLTEVLNGLSTKEIAETLFLSEKTVEGYRSNLFLKFEVKNVASLVKKALLKGFLS